MTDLFINGRFVLQPITGVQRYAREVVSAFDRLLAQNDRAATGFGMSLLVPEGGDIMPLNHIETRISAGMKGHFWEQWTLRNAAKSGYLLSLCNTGPIFARRHAVTLHDASVYGVPAAYTASFRLWYRTLLPALARRADPVITVSHFSADELAKHLHVPVDRFHVVLEGADHAGRAVPDFTIRDRLGIVRPFFLAVGSRSPHKNLQILVPALERTTNDSYDIVIAGGANARIFSSGAIPTTTRIRYTGYLTEQELAGLYRTALGLIFPSKYEGFGLPPLEAMEHGCAVISSTAGALREVCGDAAAYIDPFNAASVASAMDHVANDAAYRSSLQVLGRARAGLFRWDDTARAILQLIREADVREQGSRNA